MPRLGQSGQSMFISAFLKNGYVVFTACGSKAQVWRIVLFAPDR
ncbi:hypothetical protein SAMN04490183_1730 [Pseudomonas corrugata]|nr:hypothetical protein SAMN04490183_1730 [Pseudomonas corrugata]